MGPLTDFLFARPSFLEGVARIMDLGSTLTEYNQSESPAMADFRALRADWRVIGEDMRRAMGIVQRAVPPVR